MNRRAFLVTAVGAGAHVGTSAKLPGHQHFSTALRHFGTRHSGTSVPVQVPVRDRWLATLERVAEPVLSNLAAGTLKARMPVEEASGANRGSVTHLEAFGRLMAGIAPWLDLEDGPAAERALRTRYRALTAGALTHALDPASPDALNFTEGGQPLVDAAFLAQAVLRAPGSCNRGSNRDAHAAHCRVGVGARHPARLQQLVVVCRHGRSRAEGAGR